jgi:hypothetical protein
MTSKVNSLLSKANVVTSLVLIYFFIGAAKVLGGDLEFNALISLMGPQIGGLAVGRGLATVKSTAATGATSAASVATVLVLLYALLGGVQVVVDDLTFEAYLESMNIPVAGLAVGRGIAANNK